MLSKDKRVRVRFARYERTTPLQRRKISPIIVGAWLLVLCCVIAILAAGKLGTGFGSLPLPHLTTKSKPAVPIPVGQAYGIAAGGGLPALSAAELDQRLTAIQATGARWIRFDFSWADIQPDGSATYDWGEYDRIVAAAGQHHLAILGIITYTPAWARSNACPDAFQCEPADPAQFAKFAGMVARRYAPRGVHYWEIWNEPNNPDFWQPAANPAHYAQLLAHVYPVIRQQDPTAFVVTGSLSPQATTQTSLRPADFLTQLYRDGGRPYFDAVGDHPYTFPLSPDSTEDQAWNQMASDKNSLRSIMVANNDGSKRIWITEFGAPTGGPGAISTISNPNLSANPYVVDEALQAKILADALKLYRGYPWSGPFFYYSYQDAGTDPSTNENFFGLVRYDGTKKPAYAIFSQAAHAVAAN